MRRLLLVAAAALMLAVAGCSGSPSAGDALAHATGIGSNRSSSTPTATPSATPVTNCLNGRYRLVRFVGVGDKGTFGTGEGGDVTVTFDKGPTCCAAQARTRSS